MSYTKTDHQQITAVLGRLLEGIEDASEAVLAGEAEHADREIERARSERSAASKSFPTIIVNDSATLTFDEVYPDLYDIDLLIIITFQWPDTAPTSMTEMKELVDAFGEKLANLRQLRAQPWADAAGEGLTGLDGLIDRCEELRVALETLPARARIDPRHYTWLGQDFKAKFLDGVCDGAQLGSMYRFVFSLDHALERARWSVGNRKMPGANRRLIEAKRIHGLLMDWMRENEPAQ